MLNIFKGLHLLLVTLLLASCLPQEKTTQCKSNEAYDATARRCVATLGANGQTVNISNVTPTASYTISFSDPSVTHSITVSDPYSSGYQVRWYLTKPNGTTGTTTTSLVGTGASLTFNHTAEATGSYILEVQLLDVNGSQIFDSRSWTINVIQETTPSIYTETPSAFSTTVSDAAPTTIDAQIQNPSPITGVEYEWRVNGNPVTGESGSTSATTFDVDFDFDPTSASTYYTGSGIYAVQLILRESGTTNQYDTKLWTITNQVPNFATVSLGNNTTTFAASTATPAAGTVLTAIDEVPISGTGFAGIDGGLRYTQTTTLDSPVDLCVRATESDADSQLDGVNGDGVWVDFLLDGLPIAGAIDIQMVNEFDSGTEAATTYCLSEDGYNDFAYDLPSNVVKESHTLSIVVYDKFTGTSALPKYKGYNQISKFDYTLRTRQKNTPPVITILDTTDDPLEYIDCNTKSSTQYSDCTITWGDNRDAYTTANPVRPIKLRVKVEDDDYDPIDAGESANFELEIYVQNELADTNMPGKYSFSDCAVDPATTAIDGDGYFCDIIINPFDVNGVVDYSAATFTIGAIVRDKGSPYDPGNGLPSNTVQWLVNNVEDYNDEITLLDFDSDTDESYVSLASTPGSALSIYEDNTTAQATEGQLIQFHVEVQDAQRDTHKISIDQLYCDDTLANAVTVCDPNNGGFVPSKLVTLIPDVATTTVAWGNVDQTTNVAVINHQIRYDAIEGTNQISAAGEGIAYYRVTVEDATGAPVAAVNGTHCNATDKPACTTTDTYIVRMAITNDNPDPTFDDPGLVDPALPSSLTVLAGLPVTIDPGPISDASTADGENIEYQWVVSSTGAANSWTQIVSNNDRKLVWTPSPEIALAAQENNQTIQIKLCLGDDGFDNGGNSAKTALNVAENDCADPDRDSSTATAGGGLGQAWDLTVVSNMAAGMAFDNNEAANTGLGEVATWIDPSSTDPIVKYTAYVTINKQIVVEKHVIAADGTKGGSLDKDFQGNTAGVTELDSIIFDASTDAAFAANDVNYLSMAGDSDNGALYIAYMAPIGGVDSLHIRRVNIGSGKTGFAHDGTFGWDPGYNDLTDNIVVSSLGISTETINSDGNAELVFTQAGNSTAMTVTFSGLHGGSGSLVGGTDFCATGCTTVNDTAAAFATAVNASTLTELQGLRAVANGATVELLGISEDDYFEGDVGAAKIGQIMIDPINQKFLIPLIDIDFAGSDKFKISMMSGDLNVRIVDSNLSKAIIADGGGNNVQASELANEMDLPDNPATDDRTIIMAVKELTTGLIHAFEINASSNSIIGANTDVFADAGVTKLKVAVSKENSEFDQSAFITGTNDTGNLALARIDSSNDNYNLANIISYEEFDAGFPLLSPIGEYDITAGPNQYQLLLAVNSDEVNAGDYHTYMVNITGVTPQASCSYDSSDLQNIEKCTWIQPREHANSGDEAFDLGIALSDILEDVTVGDAGATANENIGDFVGMANHINIGGAGSAATDGVVITSILNVRSTSLSTQEVSSTINNNEVYILPYVSP